MKNFTKEEFEKSFPYDGIEGDYAMAFNPAPEINAIKAYVFEKRGEYFSMAGETVLDFPPETEVGIYLNGDVAQFSHPGIPHCVRYDFSAHEWIRVAWDMWLERKDRPGNSPQKPHLPFTFSRINCDYFPKGKRKENFWRTFLVKNGNDYWNAAENSDADSAFVVNAAGSQCTVYAYIPSRNFSVRAFPIPKEMGFPLHIRCNFCGNTGVFCVNRKLYGTMDFDTLRGEALF